MYYKSFYHKLDSGENAKFTISERVIDNKLYYFAYVFDTNLEFYKRMNQIEKEAYVGIEMKNGQEETIYYKDPDKLESDIKMFYGQLKSEL